MYERFEETSTVTEDRRDAEIARQRIAEIEINPEKLLQGGDIDKKLKQWQSSDVCPPPSLAHDIN